jgi:CelD/BcsL family acetyltransferase involved in cellulose biosynthesis
MRTATSGEGCGARALKALLGHAQAISAAWIDKRMNDFTVLELTDPRWADFVARQPAATPFHHPAWGTLIAHCYGFRAFALAASNSTGEFLAGLPVIEVRHLRGGPKWVTLPFTDYCPPLVPAAREEKELACALQRASEAAGIRRVEIRAPLEGASSSGHGALRHVIPLEDDPAAVYAKFRRSVRRHIAQAERNGVTIRRTERREDLIDTFYRLHLRTRRRFGVPIQPRRFFRMLWESVIRTGLGSVLIAEVSGRPVAGEVCLSWNGTTISKYSASDERAWSLRANNLITWHLIRTACEQGSRWMDFGRTDAGKEGLRVFKRSWGAVEEPLVYGTLGVKAEPAPAADGVAGQLLASAIRHGPPVFCRAAGEALYRYAA